MAGVTIATDVTVHVVNITLFLTKTILTTGSMKPDLILWAAC
jgi:hypothetical protein